MKKVLIAIVVVLLSPTFAHAAFDSNLSYGSTGSKVLELQEFLTAQGVYSGPITGNFYSLTLAAVKAFQSANSVSPVSGYFGPLTRGVANTLLENDLRESNEEANTQVNELGSVENVEVSDTQDDMETPTVAATWETEIEVKKTGVDEDGNLTYKITVSGDYDRAKISVFGPGDLQPVGLGFNPGTVYADWDANPGDSFTWEVVSKKGNAEKTENGQFTAE